MTTHFDLIVTAGHAEATAHFCLLDAHGLQVGANTAEFGSFSASQIQALFDLRNYLRVHVEKAKEVSAVKEVGVCIANDILGKDIFAQLSESECQRTLRIQFRAPTREGDRLAAALARVPWEIARSSADHPTLAEKNLLVRIVPSLEGPSSVAPKMADDEMLRVLFVFAEAPGSRLLGARKERGALMKLFQTEIYPHRHVTAHFLTHGVTRELLQSQIQQSAGYHIIHWSGHGDWHRLELCKLNGKKDYLSGDDLVTLLLSDGGVLPRLVFLSACHSGDVLRVKDWNDFLAVAQERKGGSKVRIEKRSFFASDNSGFTGTAHTLVQRGVRSVVAMRYAVGDDYARVLAVEFYRLLLGESAPMSATAALTLARLRLLDVRRPEGAKFAVCDHVTPVIYGREEATFKPALVPSPEINRRKPAFDQITGMTAAAHDHFVGRNLELMDLGLQFFGYRTEADVKPVATIIGQGGIGKTALVAEILELWERRFAWIFLFQAKANALDFDQFLREIDVKLRLEEKLYDIHVKSNSDEAIYRDETDEFNGLERVDRLTRNLIRVLQSAPVLIVLDNFDNNLRLAPEPITEPAWACQHPAWDYFLRLLGAGLKDAPSRLLITSRRPLAALVDVRKHVVLLGPLRGSEAVLFLNVHPALKRMISSSNVEEILLSRRVLSASRFHPLLMDRLARLADIEALRPELLRALDALEKTKHFTKLSDLFSTSPQDPAEMFYLDEAINLSCNQLINAVDSYARILLWTIALADEDIELQLLQSVWSALRSKLTLAFPVAENLDNSPESEDESCVGTADVQQLLVPLIALGLVTRVASEQNGNFPEVTCNSLTRESISRWMHEPGKERKFLEEADILRAYADQLELHCNQALAGSMHFGSTFGLRAMRYLLRLDDPYQIGAFVGSMVPRMTNTVDLSKVIRLLQIALERPSLIGQGRWRCLASLAEALSRTGRAACSLTYYERGVALARSVIEQWKGDTKPFWHDLEGIYNNWANALSAVGKFDDARRRAMESVDAGRMAGLPQWQSVGAQIVALRTDVMEGHAADSIPKVKILLQQIENWREALQSETPVPDLPDAQTLARLNITALDLVRQAYFTIRDWSAALKHTDDLLALRLSLRLPSEEVARDHFNRATTLKNLGRLADARIELERLLPIYSSDPESQAKVLMSLAAVFHEMGDRAHSIELLRRGLGHETDISDPIVRAALHHNLAAMVGAQISNRPFPDVIDASNFEMLFKEPCAPEDRLESEKHHFAALLYRLALDNAACINDSAAVYSSLFAGCLSRGHELYLPSLDEFFGDIQFAPLMEWLKKNSNFAMLRPSLENFFRQYEGMIMSWSRLMSDLSEEEF